MGDKNILLLLDRMEFCALNSTVLSYVKNMDRNKFHFDILVAANELGSMEKQFSDEGCNVFCLCASTSDRKFKTKFAEFIQKRNKYNVVHSFLKNGITALAIAKENEIPVRIINCSENDVVQNRKNNKNDEITHIVTTGNNNESENVSGKSNEEINGINADGNRKDNVNADTFEPNDVNAGVVGVNGENIINANLFRSDERTNDNDRNNEAATSDENVETIVSVNKAVDVIEYEFNLDVAKEFRSSLGIDENQIVFLHIGNINDQFNQEFSIEIFRELKEVKNACLLFIGNEDNKREMNEIKFFKKYASRYGFEDRLYFLGSMENLGKAFSASDIILAPWKKAALSTALLAAQASGVKIFASDVLSEKINVTDTVQFLSLKKPARAWACEIMNFIFNEDKRIISTNNQIESRKQISEKNCNIILRTGYDIVDNLKKINKIYEL